MGGAPTTTHYITNCKLFLFLCASYNLPSPTTKNMLPQAPKDKKL